MPQNEYYDKFAITMAIKTYIPQVTALKNAVEKKFGHRIECRSDFANLVFKIEKETNEHIAENTLRRIWGKLKGYETIQTRTLDVLSRYADCRHWEDFCVHLKNENRIESEIQTGCNAIDVMDLNPGDRIRIGWMPDRICIIEFQGGHTFKAIECHNSTMQDGDIFECNIMLKGHPLFADNLVHCGEMCQRYSIGLYNGLTILEKIK